MNRDAALIALASFSAFALAGLFDAFIYALLGKRARLLKMNGSNIAGSIVDSVVFVLIAELPTWVIPGQIVAKIFGGAMWSLLLMRFMREK